MFKPTVVEVLGSRVQYIDAQQNSELAGKYGITSVPTMLVVEGESVVKRHTGGASITCRGMVLFLFNH